MFQWTSQRWNYDGLKRPRFSDLSGKVTIYLGFVYNEIHKIYLIYYFIIMTRLNLIKIHLNYLLNGSGEEIGK